MESVTNPPTSNGAEAMSLDDTIITTLASRIDRWSWMIEEDSLKTTILDGTVRYLPSTCCPVAVLALEAAPHRLREILGEDEHEAIAADIDDIKTDGWLRSRLQQRHEKLHKPVPDDDGILVHAAALAIHSNPETEFASAVTGLELSTVKLIVKAADDVGTIDGIKLVDTLARTTRNRHLAAYLREPRV